MERRFVHLHVHSQYSLLDGADTLRTLVEQAASLGMSAMAVTDHNNVSAAVELSRAAQEFGIKPIHGAEISMDDGSHLVLLAENRGGYSNICRILTEAHLSSRRRNPGACLQTLADHPDGIIALSGCRRGAVASLVASGRYTEARMAAERLAAIFGRSNFYIELQNALTPRASATNAALAELAQRVGVGIVATNNVHYAFKPRFDVHDALTCVRTLTTLDDIHPDRHMNAENYLKSPAEMAALFVHHPEAISNALTIADRCSPGLDLSARMFPRYHAPGGETSASYLKRLVSAGALERYGDLTSMIESRLEHELNIITALGFEDYFLAVWDIARWARSHGIRYAGRGSAADSAVAYCLHLTNVDSIARNLLFERFMSLERAQKPDIDIDFESGRRDDVADYVYDRYGQGHVASVCMFNTFRGRSAVRDFGKALGFPEADIDRFAKLLPHIPADGIRAAFSRYPEMRASGIPAHKYELLLSLAESVAGFPRHIGTHIGGLVISEEPLTCVTPLQMAAKGMEITQFDKYSIEDLGLIKLDLLSLRTLSAVEHTISTVRRSDSDFDYNRIPLDDRDTYQMLNRGETIGVFQLESPAQRALQSRLEADNIEDVVASVALIRPGPIKGNMVEPFIARRLGQEGVTYVDPRLAPILDKTYGVVLYQEQVIEIATVIAGFTPGESDRLRKVMTHFRSVKEMEAIGRDFVRMAIAHGTEPKVAEEVFSYIVGYAGYGFCEAHAAAFADTAYKTAYLTRHYPAHFYAAILSEQPMGFYTPRTLIVEAKRRGVKVLPLDINRSAERYTVEDGGVRVGLMQTSGLSKDAIRKIIEARDASGSAGAESALAASDGNAPCSVQRPFRSAYDFLRRVDISRDMVENLVLAGAFDSVAPNRKALFWSLGGAGAASAARSAEETSARVCGQGVLLPPEAFTDPDGPDGAAMADFTPVEKFKYETSILGFCVARHAMEFFRPALARAGVMTSRDLIRRGASDNGYAANGQPARVAGLIVRPHRPPTKSGKTVVFLSLEDEYGLVDVTVFDSVYQKYGSIIFGSLALIVSGTISRRGDGICVIAREICKLGRGSRG